MTNVETLLSLPLDIVVPLSAGYLSYRLAYTGKDSTHSGVDVVFISLAFSGLAKAILVFGEGSAIPELALLAFAMIFTLLASAVWRKWGQPLVSKALRWAKVSTSDRHLTAWQTLITKSQLSYTQLIVHRKDGASSMCDDLHAFRNEATGPCIVGHDGSVAFYVTHHIGKDDDEWEETMPIQQGDWGSLMTYIPASEVARIDFRSS